MNPALFKNWVPRDPGPGIATSEVGRMIGNITQTLGVDPLLDRIMVLRGATTPESAREYLQGGLSLLPDPFLLSGMGNATERLIEALRQGERIEVHGDYDSNGAGATSLLVEFFTALGANISYLMRRLPSRTFRFP